MTTLHTMMEPRASVLQTVPPATAPDHDLERDRRWAEWLAKGRSHDGRMRRRMAWFALLMGAALASLAIWR